MARRARKFMVRRSKDNLSCVFTRRARRVGSHPLGNLQAVASTRTNRINILNIEETEQRGEDFFEVKNIHFGHWWTRNWDTDRELVAIDIRVGAHTNRDTVIAELNNIIGYTIEKAPGDEGDSGLASLGGTSVISFAMENVNYCLEDGTGFLLDESDNKFVGEDLNTVIGRSDGTFLSVDTRSVSHGGGGSAGNPVVSGSVSDNTMTLTLDDATTVDIDVTSLNNGTETTIGLPNWYQTYASPGTGSSTPGAQINTLTPSHNSNPFYFGITLKRGRELIFPHSTGNETIYYGIWSGATTYTPNQAGKASLWNKHLRISSSNDEVRHGTNLYDSVGWDLSTDYPLTHGTTTLALQYEYSSNKLKLWDTTDNYWNFIATASVAEDGNPVIISSAVSDGGAIPNFSDRESVWHLIAEVTSGDDTTWRDGFRQNSVWQHNTGLHPGEKMVTTTPAGWLQSWTGFGYSGAALGQTNVQNEFPAVLQVAATEKIIEKAGFTINTNATRYDTGTTTAAMGGAKISFRYHLDNSFDVFDEDNEEVLFTKDADFDGTTQYLQMGFSGAVAATYIHTDWTFEPFADAWYHNPNNYTSAKKPNTRYIGTSGPGSQLQWGEKMYPGQEFVFQENQGGSGNTYMGIRNSDNSDWTKSFQLNGTNVTTTTDGFDITANYAVNNKWLSLRYDYGDNKLKLYDINTTGVETLITTAINAEDGNAIRIAVSGNNNIPGASTLMRYYGWEYVHRVVPNVQPWFNWRIDRPAVNNKIEIDTVLKYRQALIPGRYFQWTTSNTYINYFNGVWKSSNAASGLANVETTPSLWDWGFKGTNQERFANLLGMTFNTSNTYYDAGSGNPFWDDPNPGTTIVRLRYKSDNSVDLYDVSNSEVIATKDVDLGGEAFYLYWGCGAGITDLNDLHGGGDLVSGTL